MASDRLLKYPRTPHLPFSQGKILRTGSFLNGVLLGQWRIQDLGGGGGHNGGGGYEWGGGVGGAAPGRGAPLLRS